MKKINLLLSIILLTVASVSAQSNKEEVELFQSIFGMEKKAAVSDFIKVEGETATEFWKLYDAYEEERKENGIKSIEVLEIYSEEYSSLDDAKMKSITKDLISINNKYNKLIQKYYKKIDKKCNAKSAAQFYQIEMYFQSVIRLTIMEEVPFIGEVE